MPDGIFGVITPHPPIFVPEVGGNERRVAQASLDALSAAARALATFGPETLVLMSPHAPLLRDAFLIDGSESLSGSLSRFGAPAEHSWRGDPELASAIISDSEAVNLPMIGRESDRRLDPSWLDHATLVPLSFLDPDGRYRLVVLSLAYLPYEAHRRLGEVVRTAAEKLGRRVAFIASGDMSHRLTREASAGYSPRAAELDAQIRDLVAQGKLHALMDLDPDLVEAGGECGLRSIIALGGFCGPDPVPARVLSYEGPWGVGYLTALAGQAALDAADRAVEAVGRKGGMPGADESEIVRLARRTIETYVREGRVLEPEALPAAEYPARAGAFVSLHRNGMLRGCIGTIAPTRPTLAEEVIGNAIEAATGDPRFRPLEPSELDDLDIKVDVLQPPEACMIADLDPAKYGVIVTKGGHRGLLLPDLEGVDNVEQQVAIAMSKAGIPPGSACNVERFKVDRYT